MAPQPRPLGSRNGSTPVLFYADGYKFPDVYHVTRFLAPDPIIALEQNGEVAIVANSLEEGRARKQSRAREVFNVDEFGAKELAKTATSREELDAGVIERFLESRGVRRVAVGTYFPIGMAERLRGAGIELVVDRDLGERRRAKRPDEIAALEATQRATEDAWAKGVEALERATVRADGTLELAGEPFTAERLRAVVESRLLELGCVSEGAIIAPGKQAADPHLIGSGPLHAGEAIVMDIFPQDKATRYWADMTRTVSKGQPPAEITKLYEITRRAQDVGIKALRPGITGREVHELVEDVIWEAGYDTLRPGQQRSKNGGAPRGFIHGTGHGVGLEIHELPTVGRAGTTPLLTGDVVTVEPGIYLPELGGVRLEDMLVITETGSRNLTRAPRQLVV
ncbi:MAG: M24 family metallopeptidase [Chloroflexi bacterium]|nr:MAG: M24 family metallopeptidase [Chloroflexota bacterium]TMF57899.1 MAG: M24 family metallopeptidase [Chloroflexota bacterium]